MERELRLAARRGDLEACERIIPKCINVRAKDVNGMSALHFAVYNEHLEVARLLLTHNNNNNNTKGYCGYGGTRIPANQTDNVGQSALFGAATLHNSGMAQLLLDHGCTVSQRDIEGRTALHQAAACGADGVCKVLLLHDGDAAEGCYAAEDLHGQRAIDMAARGSAVERCLAWWPLVQRVWVLRQAQECARLGGRSALRHLPRDLTRLVFAQLAVREPEWTMTTTG